MPTSAPSSGGAGPGERLGLGAVGEQDPRDVPAAQLPRVLLAGVRRRRARWSAPARAARTSRRSGRRRRRARRAGPGGQLDADGRAARPGRARSAGRGGPWAPRAARPARAPGRGRTRRPARATGSGAGPGRRRRRPSASRLASPRGELGVGSGVRGPSQPQVVGQHAEHVRRVVGPAGHAEVDLGDGAVAVAAQERGEPVLEDGGQRRRRGTARRARRRCASAPQRRRPTPGPRGPAAPAATARRSISVVTLCGSARSTASIVTSPGRVAGQPARRRPA